MSEDSRSTKLRKFYYVANPGSGDSDDAKEDPSRSRANPNGYSSKKPQISKVSHYHRPTPSISQPNVLAIDSSVSRYQPPQPPLSSPVSTGSPSTPPPRTPSLPTHSSSNSGDLQVDSPSRSLPASDGGSYQDFRTVNENPAATAAPSRTVRLFGHLKGPFGSRPRAADSKTTRRPHTASPTVATPDPYAPQSSHSAAFTEKVIFVTSDSERFVTVDISGAKSALQIRELILSKLNIYNEDELYPYSIYRTEIGSSEVGEALSNDRLLAICRDYGDSKGNLKFLVSQSAVPTQGPSSAHTIDYPMPPVLPHLANINPLRVKRRSRSRGGSLSSASENIPLEVGYDADLENLDREASRPPARTTQSQPASTAPVHPPSPHRRPSLASQPRPSSPLLQSPEVASTSSQFSQTSDRAKSLKKEAKYGHVLPPLPTPAPPISPTRPSFSINEESSTLKIPQNRHPRSSSDAAADLESAAKAAEQYEESSGKQPRIRDYPSLPKIRQEPSRDNLRDRQTRRTYDEEDASWEIVMPPSQRDELDRISPSLQRGSRQPLTSSRYRPTSPYTSRHNNIYNPPRPSQPSAPLSLQDPRPPTQPRARVPVAANVFVNWKGEESGSSRKPTPPSVGWPSNSRLTKNATKSMDNLKINASSQSSRRIPAPQLPVTRPSTNSSRELPYSPSNITSSNLTLNSAPKFYEPPRNGTTRPLPVQGLSHGHSTDYYHNSSSYISRGGAYSSNFSSTTNDPYPRPQSAAGDSMTSPTKGYSRLQSPVYGSTLDSGESNRSPRTISPNRIYHSPGIPGPRPRPNNSSDRSGSSDIQSGPETSNTTPPRTPISPQSPRYDLAEKNSIIPEPSPPTSPENLTMNDRSAESTLRQEDKVNFSSMLKSTTQPPPTLTRQLTPPPSFNNTLIAASYGPDDGDEDEDSDNGGGTWIVRPEPATRPPLTVQIGPTDTSFSTQEPARPEVPPKDPAPSSYRPTAVQALKNAARRPESTFVDPEGDNWAPRPPPENIYDHLEKFFPKHDLDKPVIEATSGDTSPTNAEPLAALPPPVHFDERARIRSKKSIRIVAQEHKKRIDRTSRAAETTSYADNMMRKRSTKLWGSKLEEVTTAQARNVSTNSLPESPPGGPTTFKWVRGELIGKGTYGRVYLALNATTGEMIAVKQVELPQTASDKNDSRQHTVVAALKSESETLRDLDHPNIVQYLGFEETPANLSIFLEYVPGGSVGSCLHKHGKFDDNVTRSFTAQILSGLEYLHSKGILHRDMKADNILVEMSGTCKISDFGISKRTEDLQGGAFTAMQGTVFWMAPEVINTNKKGYNFKIDIWSVGCVVLEMWVGSRPWMGEEMVAVMFKLYQAKQPPPVPDDIVLSEEADDFRRMCFAINPEERPSAAELRKHPYLTLPPGWVFTGFT